MRELPETTYAILGLIDKTARSGYDLATLADRSYRHFWPISRTLMYRELGRLEKLGWVCSEAVAQERLPDKRVWSATSDGRRALADWLTKPPAPTTGSHNGFLLKFFLGARMPPSAMHALLQTYRKSLQSTCTQLANVIDELEGIPRARMGRLAAVHGLRTAETRLAWIDEVEAELSSPSLPARRSGKADRTTTGAPADAPA